jgi:hypothetical protein
MKNQINPISAERIGGEIGVSPLDFDFLIVLGFAIVIDIIDLLLELLDVLVLPKLISILIDAVAFIVIGGWIYLKTGKIAKSRAETLSMVRRSQFRAIGRSGIALLGELIPYLGLFPFWTILVILTLREK